MVCFRKMPTSNGYKAIIDVARRIIGTNNMFNLLAMIFLAYLLALPIAAAQEKAKGFTGGASFSIASGDSNYSSTAINYSLGLDKNWGGEFFKTRFSTILTGANYDFSITQSPRQKSFNKINSFDHEGIVVTANTPLKSRSYQTSRQVQDIDQFLLEFKAGNNVKLVAGRIKNDWGVFDKHSPHLSLFPRRQNLTTELLLNDRDSILAQDQVQYHLKSGIFSFQYYYFSPARIDEDFEKEQRNRLTSGTYYTQIRDTVTTTDAAGGEVIIPTGPVLADLRDIKFRVEDSKAPRFSAGIPHDDPQPPNDLKHDTPYTTNAQAFRVVAKPIWGQYAFTHHQGRDMSRALLFSSLGQPFKLVKGEGVLEDFDIILTNIPAFSQAIYNDPRLGSGALKGANYIFYPGTTMDSFEAVIPFSNKLTWRFESARFETIEGLGDNGRIYLNIDISVLTGGTGPTLARISELISNPSRSDEVKGSILYRAVRRSFATGFTYKGKAFTGDFNFFQTSAPSPINETEAEIVRLFQYFERRISSNSYRIRSNFDPETLISGKITRDFGEEKQHQISWLFDYVVGQQGQGQGFSYSRKFKNNLAFSLFAGIVTPESTGTGETYVNGTRDEYSQTFQTNLGWEF